jgi:alginate O-acetyltransferase complex protein AlgI
MSKTWLVEAVGISLACLLSWRVSSPRLRQVLLLISSYLFYAGVAHWFVGVLVASTLMNYGWGSLLRRRPTAGLLWGGVLVNLLLLGGFKYVPGISASWAQMSPFAALTRIAVPVGISFWTFEALSYLFDVYRDQEIDPSLLEFSLYMAFGPTVLSGPICRMPDMLSQFREARPLEWEDLRYGLQRIWLGIFMMMVARTLGSGLQPGQGVDAGFESTRLGGIDVWLLAIGYGFQLFFDFAGYSHIAIGVARLFGFRLPENFNLPYLSTSPSEFWTRWHMSLSFWIRDYVFLPLATARREVWWRNLSLLISMVIFGLWHKATLVFVIWGAYHGVLLVLHRVWQQTQRRFGFDSTGWFFTPMAWLVTFLAICFGWIFFRAPNSEKAFAMSRAALSPAAYHAPSFALDYYLAVGATLAGYFLVSALRARLGAEDESIFAWIPVELRSGCYAAMLYMLIFLYFVAFQTTQPHAFIYFQF